MADTLNNPPIRTPVVDQDGRMTQPWVSWFTIIYRRIGEALGRPTTAIDADLTSLSGGVEPRLSALEAGASSLDSRLDILEASTVLPSYTLATVPAAAGHPGKTIFVTNATAGPFAYVSNGTAWLRLSNEAVLA